MSSETFRLKPIYSKIDDICLPIKAMITGITNIKANSFPKPDNPPPDVYIVSPHKGHKCNVLRLEILALIFSCHSRGDTSLLHDGHVTNSVFISISF